MFPLILDEISRQVRGEVPGVCFLQVSWSFRRFYDFTQDFSRGSTGYHTGPPLYDCLPNSFTFDYLIHGLYSQGRTCNARKICDEMKAKGFVPSSKLYNSLVNSLKLEGEVDEAVSYLREMIGNQRVYLFHCAS